MNTCGAAPAPSGCSWNRWASGARPWTGRTGKAIADHPRYRQAERLILVCDNLHTHTYASFFQAFPPAEARRLAQRVQLVFTPQHGSWLNMAEPELSILTPSPVPAHGDAGRGSRAGHRLGGGSQRGLKGH